MKTKRSRLSGRQGLPARPPTRVAIENVAPEIDAGRFPIKRVVAETVEVTARIHTDGHDAVCAVLRYQAAGSDDWIEVPMEACGDDCWRSGFVVTEVGTYLYALEAWVDRFETWRRGLARKVEAGVDVSVDLLIGADLITQASHRATPSDARVLRRWAKELLTGKAASSAVRIRSALDEDRAALIARYPDRRYASHYDRVLSVTVEPERARFSAWYEMFPRSASEDPARHGSFRDVEDRLAYIREMGFDVLYLPPIHPIGQTNRKGINGVLEAGSSDVGSPWAIGSAEGGHTAIHPDLGTLRDFKRLVRKASEQGIDIALDLAFQCSPDHPWVREHPEWFRHRPDGTIQYAENPPKKYQDIFPLDFESDEWRSLWLALRDIVLYWVKQGISIFRVDNPHTKPYAFWEWLIAEIKREHPSVFFLAEAFTRPKVMCRLAKVGFSQSYTYFTWRNTARDLEQYARQLMHTEIREYCRPNFWPNTPDILPEELQTGGRPAFISRLALAATLSSSYGIYGPAFELCERRSLGPGREEYLDSEKYQIHQWNLGSNESLGPIISRINRIRSENPALQSNRNLRFLQTTNDRILVYAKSTDDRTNTLVVAVNLDPHHTHSTFVEVPLDDFGLDPRLPYQMHDLLGEGRYIWNGRRNYIELERTALPVQIYRIRRRLRTERDFDYYM